MNTTTTPIAALFEKAEDYGNTSIELLKLVAIEKTSDVISSLANKLSLVMLLSMFAIMINIALALWIGEMLGVLFYGFFIMSAFYLLFFLVIYVFGEDLIQKPINNMMIKLMLKLK